MYLDKGSIMKLRQLLSQEIIRALALGFIVFVFLALVRESLGLSARQLFTVLGLIVLGIFITFTALRLKTGRELMASTKRDWIIIGVISTIFLGGFIGVAIISKQIQSVLRFGPWSIVGGLVSIALFTWLGYRALVKHQ